MLSHRNHKRSHSFLWLSNIPLCIIYHIFIHLSIDGHIGCFHILPLVSSAAINIGMHIFFLINVFVFFGKIPQVELLDHIVVLFLTFWGTSILFSIVATPICTTNSAQGFPFLYILTNTCYFLSFCNSHSDRCEVISPCGFDLHSPDI